MTRTVALFLFCALAFFGTARAQEVNVPHQTRAAKKSEPAKEHAAKIDAPQDREWPKAQPVQRETKPQLATTQSAKPAEAQVQVVAKTRLASGPEKKSVTAQAEQWPKAEPVTASTTKASSAPAQTAKPTSTVPQIASAPSLKVTALASSKTPPVKPESAKDETVAPQTINFSGESAFTKLADGFDYPVGRPDAQGYYKARGFRSGGHLGEDWDGVHGGDTDLGDPIYAIGDGVVVFARDCHQGWGNVVIVRHAYRENGSVKNIDSLYGHLQTMLVHRGQAVTRGQKIATMGTAHGLYDAHLHLEIRKNIEIGMSRAAFARDFNNYFDPSQFIATHRHLTAPPNKYRIAMNTFTHDAKIRWDKLRNYSHAHSGGGSSESAANLKKALAAQSSH